MLRRYSTLWSSSPGSTDDGAPKPLQFPSPFYFQRRLPITLIELRMRQFSAKIRQKPRWWEKVLDTDLVAKWRREIVENDRALVDEFWGGEKRFEHGKGEKQWPRDPITEAQLNYIIDELRYDASSMDKETGIYPAAVPMVYESRFLIPPTLKTALLDGTTRLECVPEEEKDWHPNTDKQVLNLVHPSLYFLRLDETHILNTKGSNPVRTHVLTMEEYNTRLDINDPYHWSVSRSFQWLPTDFAVSETGDVRPLGYINNLNPFEHREMYSTLSSVLKRFIPLFEHVSSDSLSPERPHAVQVDGKGWYDELPPSPDQEARDDDEREEWRRIHEWPVIPDPAPFVPPDDSQRVAFSLKGRTLQVIVKLTNIVLTPDKPKYPGGTWHVEGMANERIVATGLYYYKCENITESRLGFRITVGDPHPHHMLQHHQQSDNQGCLAAWGIGEETSLNQKIGHIVATEDKCVAFPNIFQHCVQPFELEDPSKPGYRKILCFFLVDPLTKIISTSDVPPQQESWWKSESWRELALSVVPSVRSLPREMYDKVVSYSCVGAISREEAEEGRLAFMEERSSSVDHHCEEVFELDWNMCEH